MVLTMKSPFSRDQRKGSDPNIKDAEAGHGSSGPGRFLSRSEDNLDAPSPTGVPEESGRRKGSNPAVSPANSRNGRPRPNSSATDLFKGPSPLRESANTVPLGRASPAERAISKRRAASQQADARISKTKNTVTELQRQKQGLEGQLADMSRKADARQAEIAALKMKLRRAEELSKEASGFVKRGGSSESDLEAAARRDAATGTSVEESASEDAGGPEWDGQSQASGVSEVSVANLQDRLVQMEETHYSTSEELQATLQELTDLQDIVNELSKENGSLVEEKAAIASQWEAQGARLDQSRLQIQHLKHLLLSAKPGTAAEAESREAQLVQVLKATHEEHEDLKGRFVELRKAHNAVSEEHRERLEMGGVTRDRLRLLELQSASLEEERDALASKLMATESARDGERREAARMARELEQGRARLDELQAQCAAGSRTELEELLGRLREEKEAVEASAGELRSRYDATRMELEKTTQKLASATEELASTDGLNRDLEQRLTDFHKEKIMDRHQLTDAQRTRVELEERCRRLCEDKLELKASVATLERCLESVRADAAALRAAADEAKAVKAQDEAEWRQFQADLMTAVVVANDLKVEAQGDIERLNEENAGIRAKMSALNEEVERLRTRRQSRSDLLRPTASSASSLSVRSLIQSLEKSPVPSSAGIVSFRAPSPASETLSSRHSVATTSSERSGLEQLSKSSTNLCAGRPASAAIGVSPSKRELKPATSESELGQPAPELPRGILLKPAPALAPRKASYLDADKKDPLARLMADAPRGSRRNALLSWVQGRTAGAPNVEMTNFSSSWNDGLAFCALLHSFLPTKIPYATLDSKNKRRNFELAFGVGAELGIPCGLSAGEMVALERPDWNSIMAYVTEIYKHFNPE